MLLAAVARQPLAAKVMQHQHESVYTVNVRVKLTTVLGFNLTFGYSRQHLQGRPLAAGTAVGVRQLVVGRIIA